MLAPDIQAEILDLDESTVERNTLERGLRDVIALTDWNEQRRAIHASRRRR